jgi:hypothetical protein
MSTDLLIQQTKAKGLKILTSSEYKIKDQAVIIEMKKEPHKYNTSFDAI